MCMQQWYQYRQLLPILTKYHTTNTIPICLAHETMFASQPNSNVCCRTYECLDLVLCKLAWRKNLIIMLSVPNTVSIDEEAMFQHPHQLSSLSLVWSAAAP